MESIYNDALRISLTELPLNFNGDLGQVLNKLESEKCMNKPTRMLFEIAVNTPYQNNTNLIQWLQRRPYKDYVIFKTALQEALQETCLTALEKGERKALMEQELKMLYPNATPTDGLLSCLAIRHSKARERLHEGVYPCNPAGAFKGLALIINNVNFAKLDKRTGSDIDRDNIRSLLEKLGYVVQLHNDLTKENMVEEITKFKDDPRHEQADSTVVVILSHGELGRIYGSDDTLFALEDLKTRLNFQNCKHLKYKPKLLFVQACREQPLLQNNPHPPQTHILEEADAAYILKTEKLLNAQFTSDDHMQSDDSKAIHIDADYLVAYSSTPGYLSWRSETKGSWFIQALCQVIARFAETDHIVEIVVKVNEQIAESLGHRQTKQISEQTLSLRKKFYFLPKP